MKSLRRSLNSGPTGSSSYTSPTLSPPLPGSSAMGPGNGGYSNPLGRPSEKVAPPQKVIKALTSHRSTNPQELSYTAGDFWYVTGEREAWYEALSKFLGMYAWGRLMGDPLTNSRGLVPKSDFEEFGKGGRPGAGQRSESMNGNGYRRPLKSPLRVRPRKPSNRVSQTLIGADNRVYAIVQYDFIAERPDELDAQKGEPIVIMAQSNHEWFVAKPIGRLGGPGLIPVAFVEIRDPATGKPIEMLPDSIPMVEEWKKATADYKAAAIPLGKFDFASDQHVANSPYAPSPSPYATTQTSAPGNTSQSSLDRATSQSSSGRQPGAKSPIYRPEQDAHLPPGEMSSLSVPSFHKESDNYWFRLQVLFVPDERSSPAFTLSLYRTYEDFYDFQIQLLDSFPYEAGRPMEDQSPPERILPYMPGPVEDAIDDELTEYRREELDAYVKALIELRERGAGYILRHELIRGFFAAKYGDYCEETPRTDTMEELDERVGGMRIGDVRGYDVGGRSASAASGHSDRASPIAQLGAPLKAVSSSSRGPSPLPPLDTRQRPPSSGYGQSSASGSTARQSGGAPGGYSNPSSAAPYSAAPASASGSGAQPPFVKIKIYDRATDDLIAIRVHPNVTHAELLDKVRSRLGPEIQSLRYRTSMNAGGGYREVRDDRELRDWMRGEDQKLVLYAEQ